MASISSRNKDGGLFFDFRYRGVRCREQTLLRDTAVNRRKLQVVLNRIEKDIADGVFNYRNYFPNSPLAERFDAGAKLNVVDEADANKVPTFKEFCEEWFDENTIRWKDSYKRIIR